MHYLSHVIPPPIGTLPDRIQLFGFESADISVCVRVFDKRIMSEPVIDISDMKSRRTKTLVKMRF